MKATREFVDAFNQVHAAFKTSPAEIEEAKAIARADMPAAAASYLASAAMLRAGWKPLQEQASGFLARTQEAA